MSTALADAGARLRVAGLHARALAAWAGTAHLPLLPALIAKLPAEPPAARVLAAFVAGRAIELARVLDAPTLATLAAADLVDAGAHHAARALLPLPAALLVCDRADALVDPDALCWPDDSSYHLARALPPDRIDRWLDLGTGSGFAPLSRPALARAIAGADLNPRAAAATALGAALSNIAHVTAFTSDLADALPAVWRAADLVSFNAPIPDDRTDRDARRWRAAPRALFDRAWPAIAACLAPDGLAVVHSTLDAIPASLAGEQVTVIYTPPAAPRAFAVTWWRPSAAPRRIVTRRELTPDRPHLEWDDRAAAIAS